MRLSVSGPGLDRPKRAGFPPYFRGFAARCAAILFRDPGWCGLCARADRPVRPGHFFLCLGTA
ncbi:ATP-dependent DNA ligase [Burkholderia multivorans]|uniref:ATP-dependent DNA ligase n=1 Tax=Burkholderia multivorans CGD2 TaxID=513052 RepID=B9BW21_9BURK|nr:ATP-dependent DNA ligase [Burkholderia multivorans CGD2]EEE10770.1 ATP-dependent DNA ligase [Burkholderia multivorans CGD2M]PRF21206.1 ATP-dependent DNA ligase [Burkholderia multivorans]PRF34983.1 ATP-dependent DNA ligase [Burkholderia multivorans]PRF77057.1 ATP-dependent DNA ligase [Burkholderia multivorans]